MRADVPSASLNGRAPPKKRPKRIRSLLACQACRSRKAKCDRISLQERCRTCIRLDIPCVDERFSIGSPTPDISLRAEERLPSNRNISGPVVGSSPVPNGSPVMNAFSPIVPSTLSTPMFSSSPSLSPFTKLYAPDGLASEPCSGGDAMGAPCASHISTNDTSPISLSSTRPSTSSSHSVAPSGNGRLDEERPFFGPSATLSFFDKIRSSVVSGNNSNHAPSRRGQSSMVAEQDNSNNLKPYNQQAQPSTSSSSCTFSREFKGAGLHKKTKEKGRFINPYALPPREIAHKLLQTFLDAGNSVLHLLHRPKFEAEYEDFFQNYFSSPQDVDSHFLALLNICFAIGVIFSPAVDPRPRNSDEAANNSKYPNGGGGGDGGELDHYNDSEIFYHRANLLISPSLLSSTSLRTIQTLILFSQYAQSMSSPTRCWNSLGLAARMAISLGLHIEIPSSEEQQQQQQHSNSDFSNVPSEDVNNHKDRENFVSPLVVEERKRAWWACVNLDIAMAMTLGRPEMLCHVRSHVSLPCERDDYQINHKEINPQPYGVPTETSVFIHTIKLYQLVSKILNTIYHQHSEKPNQMKLSMDENISNGDLEVVLNLAERLDKWKEQLPFYLAINDEEEDGNGECDNNDTNPETSSSSSPSSALNSSWPWLKRHRHIVRCRYYNARILLFRQSLTNVLFRDRQHNQSNGSVSSIRSPDQNRKNTHNMKFQERMRRLMASYCVDAAMTLIETLYSVQTKDAGAPWYSTFYVYTSCGVLLASYYNKMIDLTTFNSYWNKSNQILKRYSEQFVFTKRAVQVLDILRRQIFTEQESTHSSKSPPAISSPSSSSLVCATVNSSTQEMPFNPTATATIPAANMAQNVSNRTPFVQPSAAQQMSRPGYSPPPPPPPQPPAPPSLLLPSQQQQPRFVSYQDDNVINSLTNFPSTFLESFSMTNHMEKLVGNENDPFQSSFANFDSSWFLPSFDGL